MAKAIVNKVHNATDTTKGVSVRLRPDPEPQTLPVWVIDSAVNAGAATRVDDASTSSAKADTSKKDG